VKNLLLNAVEERKEELFKLLGDLIKINSEDFGSTGNEYDVAKFIESYLAPLCDMTDFYSPDSVEGIKENPDYLAGRSLENRPNVTGLIKGTDSTRSLMFAGHSDTVPIGDESSWSFPPLLGEVRDGKVLGRGACDDKYAIASSLFLMKLMRDLDIKLPYDFYFTAYSDEEYGGGNGTLAACLKYKCTNYLNLDCKAFEIWTTGVGGGGLQFNIEADAPKHTAADVLNGLNILKAELDAFGIKRRAELNDEEQYQGTNIPDTAMLLMEVKAGNMGNDLGKGYINMEYFTTKTEPEIMIEINDMVDRVNSQLSVLGLRIVSVDKTTRFFHFVKCERENNYAIETLKKSSIEASGRELRTCGACMSDLSLFIKHGSPKAFSFGIGRGFAEPGGAHQNDEFVECDKLVEFTKTLAAFLMNY